jgi:eukaryotic-like serine/threonine-protein kinase
MPPRLPQPQWGAPVWSPDGKQIFFCSDREGGVFQIFRKDVSGAGQEERLTEGPAAKVPDDLSKDGKYLLYQETNPGTGIDIMALPLDGDRKPIPVVKTQFDEFGGAFSPDGRWVAYVSRNSGRSEVYVTAFPSGPKGRWQVSTGGGDQPKWRGDGTELYYEGPGQLFSNAGFAPASPVGAMYTRRDNTCWVDKPLVCAFITPLARAA